MNIKHKAQSGSLESNDIFIMIEPYDNGIKIDIDSVAVEKFGERIKNIILDTLNDLNVKNASIKINDKGALDYTIKARTVVAINRAALENKEGGKNE